MAEKNLTEAGWKAFSKGKGYKDAALLKALGAADKAEKSGPAAMLEALADVEKQSELLLKLHKGDKDLAAYVGGVAKAVAKERKAAEQTSDSDEAESPALLTTRLVPLLRQVKSGDAVQALIASAGKDTVVMLSRGTISPSRRKLLTDHLGTTSGVKFVAAECLFEKEAHTFVVQGQAAGLAKKLKAALLSQTGMRVKVRVRGLDPDDVDEAGDDDAEAAADDAAAAGAAAAPAADAAAAGATAAEAPNQQLAAAYQAKLAQLQPRVDAAAGSADAPKHKALLDFAAGKAREENFAGAAQALVSLEKLLASAPKPQAAGVDAGAAFNARLAALMPKVKTALAAGGADVQTLRDTVAQAGAMARDKNFAAGQALLDETEALLGGGGGGAGKGFDEADFRRRWEPVKSQWDDAIDTVNGQISQLQTALRALNDADLADIADNGLLGVTGNFKTPMMAALLDIQNARGPALRKAAARGLKIAEQFRNYLDTEETVRVTDDNEFGVPVTMRTSLGGALRQIETTLKTAAA